MKPDSEWKINSFAEGNHDVIIVGKKEGGKSQFARRQLYIHKPSKKALIPRVKVGLDLCMISQILTCKLCRNEFYSFLINKNTTKTTAPSIINISWVQTVLTKGCVYNIREDWL